MTSHASPRILFISHDASRTGAPFCLLHLLCWLKLNTDFNFEILLRNPGPLAELFAQLGPVHVYREPVNLYKLIKQFGFLRAIKPWLRQHFPSLGDTSYETPSFCAEQLLVHVQNYRPSLIYSNTVVNGDLLKLLDSITCPVVSHIHELRNIIDLFGLDNWNNVRKCTDRFIAASPAVKHNLVENYGVASDVIDVVYEFIPVSDVTQATSPSKSMRRQLQISEDGFVVCGSGLDAWRKGTDLFIRVASEVIKHSRRPVFFIWVGGWLSEEEKAKHLSMSNQLGISENIHFTGMVGNPLDYFAIADAFALTSREDPFPLACLEAAALGKPILCFANAGGMPDFVENDAGFIVKQEDCGAMATKITYLIDHPDSTTALGMRAQLKVFERHDVDVGARQILEIISQLINSHRFPIGKSEVAYQDQV